MELCTCQYSTFENDLEPLYIFNPKINKKYNFSSSTGHSKLNSKISNVKIQNFIINKENSNLYSNFINLNKSEYFFNGNEIGSFSSYDLNNKNPTKNIISVKNGTNNKKYVVKIKLYGNKMYSDEADNNSKKYKKYTNKENKYKTLWKNNYSYKNITMPFDIDNKTNYFSDKIPKLSKNYGLNTDRIYHRDYEQTLNPTMKFNITQDNNRIMNDQEILDYLNTNNTEKKNLIKKILNNKLGYNKQINGIKKIPNKKNIHLNSSKSYSYINNNYNYFYDNQTSPSYIVNNKDARSFKYFEDNGNSRIIFDKKNLLRPCGSNEIISYREYKKGEKSQNSNSFSLNQTKKLKNTYSYNPKGISAQNNNLNPIHKKIDRIKNINNKGIRIIPLNNKNRLKNSNSSNQINLKQKQINANKNKVKISKENEIKNNIDKNDDDKKIRKVRITNYIKDRKVNSIGMNSNIEDKKENINKLYRINKTINEQFNERKKDSHSEKDNLEISVQSMNDSKIMELARNYMTNEDNLNRNEINKILNCKKGFV